MAISRPRLIEQEGLLGRAAPQRVVAAPVAAPVSQPPVVAAPAPVATQARAPIAAAPKVGWQDMMNSLPNKDPGYGAVLGSGRIQAMVDTEKAQRDWFNTYHPELFKDIGWGNAENQTGWRIGYDDGTPILYRWRSDLGNVTEQRPISPDGTLGNVRWGQYDSGNGVIDALKVAAPIALSAFGAPYLATAFGGGFGATIGAGAITGAAGSAITGGDILKGAALGGIGGGIGYGINNSGLLGSVGDATSGVGTLPTDLGLQPLTPINPVEITLQDLPMPGSAISAATPSIYSLGNSLSLPTAPGGLYDLGKPNLGNATGIGGSGSGLVPTGPVLGNVGNTMQGVGSVISQPAPSYNLSTADPVTTPNGEGLSTGPVNGGTGSGLSATPGSGLTLADPGAANGLLGGSPSTPSIEGMIEQAKAAGKSVQDWMKENPLYARAAMMAGGALLNTVGGESSSGGSGYKDDGYRPTISRGGFQASIPAPGSPSGGSGMAPGGFGSGITLPSTGQANDGLWRYAGNRPGGLMPSLSAAMPRSLISPPPMAPQTGLINPPASYNPNPTGPLPTNLPPMQYGYDDPVVNKNPPMSPDMQRALTQFGLLNTNPAPSGWM